MKLRLPTRPLLNCTNPNRPIPSNTLYTRHNNRLLISHTYLPRRKLWLSYSVLTCKRSLHILHLPLRPHGTRSILRLPRFSRNMKYWSYSTIHGHSHCIRRLRPALRTNIILSISNRPPHLPSRNRIQQPHRYPI
uniref:Uncharacterized protein n=1 Tax=Balaenoptera musculus TaxID=9771 RepID=A0A8C0CLY6_BALMU